MVSTKYVAAVAIAASIAAIGISSQNQQGLDLKLATELQELTSSVDDMQKIVMYQTSERLEVSDKEIQCLAKNIFHEAGVEARAGKIAVGQVTLNRVKTGRWGNTICEVVYAKAQFSWTKSKKLVNSAPKGRLWREAIAAAYEVTYWGERIKGLEDSGFYHTDYISLPKWANDKKVVKQIGQHIFYEGTDA